MNIAEEECMKIVYKNKVDSKAKKADFAKVKNLRQFILAVRKVVADAKKEKNKKVAILIKELPKLELGETQVGVIIAREALMADYEFTKYLSKPKEGGNFIAELMLVGTWRSGNQVKVKDIRSGIERGKIVAGEINMCRELANTPGGEMTPLRLAEAASEASRGTPLVNVEVLGQNEMEALGMGAILGVAKGSPEEPQFIVMEYFGADDPNERPIVLIGKGVTFDTGGLNLKPEAGINDMHMDMSGGAACIHALVLAAKLGVKKNIVVLVPAVENMPGGASYRPGDVLRSMSDKSIEIKNTDAEGRVILADALTYAKKYNPAMVIDVATLTGASVVALGERASAIFSRDNELITRVRELGESSGDYVWPLPIWEEYEEEIKGTFGDVANLGKKWRMGGAIAGAVFLLQFAKDLPKDCKWLHIDMAPTMLATDDEFLAKGAKGSPIRHLLALI